ncbi:MAG: redox-sensing transcriptional repressor Rex [Clostridia bacterium]|nr:redox-sensing transcriptional repressor Rex [Clostridia bacterium]
MGVQNNPVVSRQVKTRLPRYYRYLKELLDAGIYRISSGKLAKMMALTASQIRQDLNYFGCFGQQGYGYNVKYLFAQISEILGVNDKLTAVIIGVGNLGRAMAQSNIFLSRGINLIALFDKSEELIGKEISGKCIYDIENLEAFMKDHHVDVAVLTLTSSQAQPMAKRLESAGVRGIWNFTNVEIPKMKSVSVMNVYMGDSLMQLCFDIRQQTSDENE